MKRRYLLYLRGRTYYCEDTVSRKQTSLRTKDRAVASRLLHCRNEAEQQPAINLQIARAYLAASDPHIATRNWQLVMVGAAKLKKGPAHGPLETAGAPVPRKLHAMPPDDRHWRLRKHHSSKHERDGLQAFL